MEYTNPELPEDINTTKQSALKELVILTSGLMLIVFAVIYVVILLIDNFADKIPFELEKNIPANRFIENLNPQPLPPYLQMLSQQVIANAALPDEMEIKIHFVNSDTVNAFATLGGHIVLYRGLLEKLKYEDEITTIIAHEVAHIKYRHPILAASHGLVVAVLLSVISSSISDSFASNIVNSSGMASLLKFSREFEFQSDKEAIEILFKVYGHANGALELFKFFKSEASKESQFEFMATHPLTQNRILHSQELISQKKNIGMTSLRKIPDEFVSWLALQKEKEVKKSN